MSQAKIVLMACGSFNPPTPMHLRMFELARDYIHSMNLGKVIGGIISPVNDGYSKKDLASSAHRVAMLKLALRSSDWIKISDWEMNQDTWTRTKASLTHHQDQLNVHCESYEAGDTGPAWLPDDILNVNSTDQPDNARNGNDNFVDNVFRYDRRVRLKLLCGADLLESFAVPGLWSDEDLECILGNHGLVVVSRGGTHPEKFINESDLLSKFKRNITLVTNWVANEISSTCVRRLLRRGESVKYLIDDAIIAYIQQHKLYGCSMGCSEDVEYKILSFHTKSVEKTTHKNRYIKKSSKRYFEPTQTDASCAPKEDSKKHSYAEMAAKRPGRPLKVSEEKVRQSNDLSVDMSNVDLTKRRVSSDGRFDLRKNTNNLEVNSFKKLDASRRRVSSDDRYKNRSQLVSAGSKSNDRCLFDLSKRRDGKDDKKIDYLMKKSASDSRDLEKKLIELKTRSCNDIVRLVLTKHGIQVISDSEAIV